MVDGATASLWCITAGAGLRAEERNCLAGELASRARSTGSILLSTCQRVELYGFGQPPAPPPGTVLVAREAAARHLFRVAAGLESAAVGENEILGQVRQAVAGASGRGLDVRLSGLFAAAVACGRRCRAGLEPSGSSLAALAAHTLLGLVEHRRGPILVVGAGYMGRALAAAVSPRWDDVIVGSRSVERATVVAHAFGLTAVSLDAAAKLASEAAGVAVALSAKWQARFARESLPPVVDVSSPPAIDPAASTDYAGIDQLLAAAGRESSGHPYAARAGRVVEAELAAYLDSLEKRERRIAV